MTTKVISNIQVVNQQWGKLLFSNDGMTYLGKLNSVDVTFWQTSNRYYFSLLVHTIAGNCIQVHKGKQINQSLFYRLYDYATPYDEHIHTQYTNNQYHFTINL